MQYNGAEAKGRHRQVAEVRRPDQLVVGLTRPAGCPATMELP